VVARVAVSMSLVVLLTLTAPWIRLLAALRGLSVSRIFILIISIAYRCIFLLLASEEPTNRHARCRGSSPGRFASRSRERVMVPIRSVTTAASALVLGKAVAKRPLA